MQKMYVVQLKGIRTYKTIFGKEKTEYSSYWPYYVMTENAKTALEKAKKCYAYENEDTTWQADPASAIITDWDTWSVNFAMKQLTGKQFAEWAAQQGLSSLCKCNEGH